MWSYVLRKQSKRSSSNIVSLDSAEDGQQWIFINFSIPSPAEYDIIKEMEYRKALYADVYLSANEVILWKV
jgi:hypothetical protein